MTENVYHDGHQDEVNRVGALKRQEARHAADRARYLANIAALGPGPQIESDFPGCFVTAPPEAI